MDTKRNPSKDYIVNRAVGILDSIKKEKSDLLIVSDDNAVKYMVEGNPQDIDFPERFFRLPI